MIIGERLRMLREQRKISRGDMEKRTGLLRCYICRVENGYTVPAVETLAKFANALKIPIYRLFYDGGDPPQPLQSKSATERLWGRSGNEAELFKRFRRHLGQMAPEDRGILLFMAQRMVEGKRQNSPPPKRATSKRLAAR
jgi:transcriptional regulator with XRE-family HTH domain